MAKYRLTAPDGGVYMMTAPDDASEQQVFDVFRQSIGGGEQQAKPDPEQQMYEGRARYMRQANPNMTRVRDFATRLVEGTPIGSWLDEAMAGAASVLPQSLGGQPYADAKGVLDADRRIRDAESTKLGTLPIIGDVTAGGINKLAGAIASAPLTPMAHVFRGGTMLPQAGNAAVTGAGYGAVYGAGEGNAADERAVNAAIGTALGAGIGAAAVPVARGAGNVVSSVRNRATPLPEELQQFRRGAVDRMHQTLAMDGVSAQQAGEAASRLGPEAMLLDAGPNMTTIAEGLNQQPGLARTAITGALEARREGAVGRIRHGLDDALGPPVNVDASIKAMRRDANQDAGPLYEQFYGTQIPVDAELVSILQAVPDNVWPRVRSLMQAERIDPNIPLNTGRAIDLIKRGIDDAAREAGRGTNVQRVYSNLARNLRDHVDNLVSPGNPAESPWARARAIVGEGRGAEEALDEGMGVFRAGGRAPEQVKADLAGMSDFERNVYGLGGRSELRNRMGRAATNFRANGDSVARRAMNSEFNRQNVELIAGRRAADRLTNTIDAENAFAENLNQITGNSATARRQAARDIIPPQYEASQMKHLRGTTLSGFALEAVGRLVNHMSAGALNERNATIARDMAEMLIAQGAERDQVVRGLMQYARSVRANNRQRTAIAALARDVMRATSQPAISAATAD